MSELAEYTSPEPAGLSSIRQTALELSGAKQIADAICSSTFVPMHFRNKPEECAVAILYGATIGFDPVTSIQQIYVISGKPALYARAMVAIVLSAGHEIWTEDEGPGTVTVAGRRKGSDHIQRVTWTTAMADQAGYTSNAKYRSDPRSMLYARASGDVARRIAPDALLGMAYNVEEMQLVPHETVVVREPSSRPQDRVRAALGQQTSGSADASDRPAPEVPPAAPTAGSEDQPKLTSSQSKKLHATFSDLGIKDRPDRLAYASKVVGRELSSSSEMTKAEASAVIEALVADVQARNEEPVVGELVEDRESLLSDVYDAGDDKGFDKWALQAKYAEIKQGELLDDAAIEDLKGFLGWIAAQPEVAA